MLLVSIATSILFLVLSVLLNLPLACYSAYLASKGKNQNVKNFSYFLLVIIFGLIVASTVLNAIGIDDYVCSWVGFGLFLGATVLNLFDFCINISYRGDVEKNTSGSDLQEHVINTRKEESKSQTKPARSMDYIAELKALKELLDCGALTQEEFDMKKKEILNRR